MPNVKSGSGGEKMYRIWGIISFTVFETNILIGQSYK